MPKQSRVILGNGPGSTGQVGIDPATSTALAWSLACIIIVSAGVRLYHLGVPSLWWDEILACSVARNSLSYIFDRSLHIDLYSPLFYLVVKCGQFVDMGDGVARLPFVVFGVLGVVFVYRLGAGLIGPGPALMAAGLLGANYTHLSLSRQVRPYALIFILALFALFYLCRISKTWRSKDAYKLLVCLALLVFMHQSNLLIAGAAGMLLSALVAARRDKQATRVFVIYCLGMLALIAAASPFILSGIGQHQWIDETMTRWDLAIGIFREGGLLVHFDYRHWTQGAMAALAAVGFLDLRRKEPVFAWLALGMLVLPLLILVAMNYQYRYFSFRHLTFLLPAFMLLAGRGLFFLVRPISSNPVVAVLLFLLSLGLTLRLGEGRLFDEHSYMSGWKAVARSVAGAGAPGSPYLLPDIPSITELNWYLDAYQAPSSLRDQRIGPEAPVVELNFLDYRGVWDHGEWKNDQVLAVMPPWSASFDLAPPGEARRGRGVSLERFLQGKRLVYRIERAPIWVIADLPFSMSMDLKPTAFYRHLYQAQGVMLLPGKRFSVIASANDREGSLEYRFVNRVPDYPQIISLAFTASTQGPGNRLSVLYRFDSEPFQTAAFLDDPAAKAPSEVSLERREPYRTLTVRFELFCGKQAPSFGGENLGTLRLESFSLQASNPRWSDVP